MDADRDLEHAVVAADIAAKRLQAGRACLRFHVIGDLRRQDHRTDLLLHLDDLFLVTLLEHHIDRIGILADVFHDSAVGRIDKNARPADSIGQRLPIAEALERWPVFSEIREVDIGECSAGLGTLQNMKARVGDILPEIFDRSDVLDVSSLRFGRLDARADTLMA